jgi:DNA polymerase/3'-5' exonuclease PolX
MKLEKAKESAKFMLGYLKPYVKKAEIVGSVRRECAECQDIDIILIPNDQWNAAITGMGDHLKKKGSKIVMCEFDKVQYDLYICNEDNWEVIKLIRTGSASHNRKLCSLAIEKGMKLKASGMGLIDKKENIVSNTEKGILETLLGHNVAPKDRA